MIVTGADAGGGPHVKVFNADDLENEILSFFAFEAEFPGGVRVAAGDINGDDIPDIIAVAGSGGGPHVKVFDGSAVTPTDPDRPVLMHEFFAYTPGFAGGVFTAVGDVNNDGYDDLITTPGAGGDPHVKVFSGADIKNQADPINPLYEIFVDDPSYTGGVHCRGR